VANSGLTIAVKEKPEMGDIVDLSNNPLSTTSVNVYIPQLEARGVIVEY